MLGATVPPSAMIMGKHRCDWREKLPGRKPCASLIRTDTAEVHTEHKRSGRICADIVVPNVVDAVTAILAIEPPGTLDAQ